MREKLDAAVSSMDEIALTAHVKEKLGVDDKKLTLDQLMTLVDDNYLDKSESRQEELGTAARIIKMYRNRPVEDYITIYSYNVFFDVKWWMMDVMRSLETRREHTQRKRYLTVSAGTPIGNRYVQLVRLRSEKVRQTVWIN